MAAGGRREGREQELGGKERKDRVKNEVTAQGDGY